MPTEDTIRGEHTVRAYDEELDSLTAELSRMGGLAEAEVVDAIRAIARRDVALAQAVIGRDARLDEIEFDIERRAVRLIALRQPVADDLRRTLSALKISMNLERCGDLAKNIAKRALVIAEADPVTPLTRSIERMGELVASRLKDVLDAYASRDDERAQAVWPFVAKAALYFDFELEDPAQDWYGSLKVFFAWERKPLKIILTPVNG